MTPPTLDFRSGCVFAIYLTYMVTQSLEENGMESNRRLLAIFVAISLILGASSYAHGAGPQSALEVTVPDYEVSTVANLDYVDIPGGHVLLVDGKPRVPYYSVSVDYPKGHRVQEVTLAERSGLVTATGLKLPTVVMEPWSFSGSDLPPDGNEGWYPEEDYRWRVWENPKGSTTLVIVMYPFYYNSQTTDVRFYQNYRFDIEYIISTVTITTLSTDRDAYEPGDEVTLDMCLNNSGETQNIFVSLVIKQYGTGEIIEGLPVRSLKDFVGEGSCSAVWSTGDAESGYYYAEAILTDTSGNVLDKNTVGFGIQVSEAEEEEQPPPAEPGEFPTLYVIIGAVVIVAIITVVLAIKLRKKA